MKVGDTAEVMRSDGVPVRFTAYRVERFSKSTFPTGDVYGNTDGPSCGSSPAAASSTEPPTTTGTTSSCSPG